LFWYGHLDGGFEPIAVQHAGGMLLPPVQKLVATSIFFCQSERKCKSNPPSPTRKSSLLLQ